MEQSMQVKPNQSFLDVILQSCGTMEAGMKAATENGWPISHLPAVGTEVYVAAHKENDMGILKYLQQNSIIIGTKAGPLRSSVLITEDGMEDLITEDGTDVLVDES